MRYNGSWRYSPEGGSAENDHALQSALAKMINTKPEVQGCQACAHGIYVSLGRKHTVECRQTVLLLFVTDSLWTVKFNADGKSLKRHEHEDDDDNRDQKRVQFIHKQLVKRADSEMTDDKDTDAKRAKLCDTPSSSSSSHEFARCSLIHLGSMRALKRVKATRRNRVWAMTWRSVPSRRSRTQSWWSSTGHSKQDVASCAGRRPT